MTTTRKYLRTELPPMLRTPLPLVVEGALLAELNLYRQARHDFFSCPADAPLAELRRRERLFEVMTEQLAVALAAEVRSVLNEPAEFD